MGTDDKGRYIKRILVYGIIAFGIAIYISTNTNLQFIPKPTAACLLALLAVLAAFLIGFHLSKRPTEMQKHMCMFLCLLLAFFIFGVLRVYIFENINPVWRGLDGKTAEVYGSIISKPSLSKSGKTYGVLFNVDKAVLDKKEEDVNENIWLYVPCEYGEKLKDGIDLRCTVRLSDYAGASYIGGFSLRKYYLQDKCRYFGYTEENPEVYEKEGVDLIGVWRRAGRFLNEKISASVDNILYDGDENALLKGILTGSKENISDELIENMSRSGFSHIASVSGMHVNYLFIALMFLFGVFRLRKSISFALTIPVLLIFVSVASFTPSVCRAIIVMIIFIIAHLVQREPDSLTSLFVAAFLILIYNPYMLYSVSFILSFSSTLSIILFASLIKNNIPNILKKGKFLNFLCDSISISFSGMIGVSFFVAYFFNIISLAGIITNIWAPLLCAILFFLGYANAILWLISPMLSKLFSIPVYLLLKILILSSDLFSDTFLVIDVPTPPKASFFIYLIITLMFYCFLKSRKKEI